MAHFARKCSLALALMLILTARGLAATLLGSITISGTEQSSGSTWDTGTVTATINGVTVSYTYGQFTTPQAVASALGALISNSCNMPVHAQANGASLNFYQKGTNTITSASLASASSNPSLFPSNSFLLSGLPNISPPVIGSVSLPEGPPSMGFVITGAYFGSAPGSVTVGGQPATIVSWSSGSIIAQVPGNMAPTSGAVPLIVASPIWSANIGPQFTFTVVAAFGCN